MFITPDASPDSASSEPLKVVVALSGVVRLGPGFGWSCTRSLKTGIPLPACGVTAAAVAEGKDTTNSEQGSSPLHWLMQGVGQACVYPQCPALLPLGEKQRVSQQI